MLGREKEQSQSAKFATVRPIEELSWRKLNGPFDSMYTREKDGSRKFDQRARLKNGELDGTKQVESSPGRKERILIA